MKVLIVEDQPQVRTGMARALSLEGFQVTEVGDAFAAAAELERQRFDAILCDIKLPFLDGRHLYRLIEANHPFMTHRVIFVTAMTDDPSVSDFLKRTGRPVVAKPFELNDLVATVRRIAEQSTMLEEPIVGMRIPDRERARAVPAEFAVAQGAPLDRLKAIVSRHWGSVTLEQQRHLVQVLRIVLQPVVDGGEVTPDLERQCEDAIMDWLARQ